MLFTLSFLLTATKYLIFGVLIGLIYLCGGFSGLGLEFRLGGWNKKYFQRYPGIVFVTATLTGLLIFPLTTGGLVKIINYCCSTQGPVVYNGEQVIERYFGGATVILLGVNALVGTTFYSNFGISSLIKTKYRQKKY